MRRVNIYVSLLFLVLTLSDLMLTVWGLSMGGVEGFPQFWTPVYVVGKFSAGLVLLFISSKFPRDPIIFILLMVPVSITLLAVLNNSLVLCSLGGLER